MSKVRRIGLDVRAATIAAAQASERSVIPLRLGRPQRIRTAWRRSAAG